MDDRYNYCDVCHKEITSDDNEMETPEGLVIPYQWGDGVIHKSCLPKLIDDGIGAGI